MILIELALELKCGWWITIEHYIFKLQTNSQVIFHQAGSCSCFFYLNLRTCSKAEPDENCPGFYFRDIIFLRGKCAIHALRGEAQRQKRNTIYTHQSRCLFITTCY